MKLLFVGDVMLGRPFSYVLAGTTVAMTLSFGSTCHGAGRTMLRLAAKKIARLKPTVVVKG